MCHLAMKLQTSLSIKGFRYSIILHGVGSVVKVFDSRVPRRIFGPKRDKVRGEWRKIHKLKPYDLYCSPNIFQVVKWRWMRWAGNVACMGERRGVYRVLVGKPEGKRPLGRPRHRWDDILRWIFRKWDVGVWTRLIWLRKGTDGRHLWMR